MVAAASNQNPYLAHGLLVLQCALENSVISNMDFDIQIQRTLFIIDVHDDTNSSVITRDTTLGVAMLKWYLH